MAIYDSQFCVCLMRPYEELKLPAYFTQALRKLLMMTVTTYSALIV